LHDPESNLVPDRAADGQACSRPADVCPECGRSVARYLTLTEACERHGYGRAACFACLLTDLRRGS
jgi:hypothetical protein